MGETMETKKKDDRKLLGSQIEDRILEYIKEKPLEVGDRLPNEFELAEMFEVGRSTIREAVKGLVTKGVLQVRRGAGTYVSSLTPAEDDPLRLNAKLHDRFKLALPKDIEFHTWIARCSKNQVMESLIPIINSGINTFVNLTRRSLRTETITTHRAITEAIANHDSTGARCAMVMHLTYNRQELLRRRTAYKAQGETKEEKEQ